MGCAAACHGPFCYCLIPSRGLDLDRITTRPIVVGQPTGRLSFDANAKIQYFLNVPIHLSYLTYLTLIIMYKTVLTLDVFFIPSLLAYFRSKGEKGAMKGSRLEAVTIETCAGYSPRKIESRNNDIKNNSYHHPSARIMMAYLFIVTRMSWHTLTDHQDRSEQ